MEAHKLPSPTTLLYAQIFSREYTTTSMYWVGYLVEGHLPSSTDTVYTTDLNIFLAEEEGWGIKEINMKVDSNRLEISLGDRGLTLTSEVDALVSYLERRNWMIEKTPLGNFPFPW